MLTAALHEHISHNPVPRPIVYHYCSTQVLLSIIENSCIWLSDASKTNDKTEMRWLFSNVLKIFDQTIERYKGEYEKGLLQKTKDISHSVIESFSSKKARIIQTRKDYLACFTENSDLLSQWRAYASNGEGVAIGFNTQQLLHFQNGEQYEFTKVIYDQSITEDFIEKSINASIKYLLDSNSDSDKEADDEMGDLSREISLLMYKIYGVGFFFKNPYFFEEQEWRLYRKISSSNYSISDGVDDYGYSELNEGIFTENTKFVGDFSRGKLKFLANESSLRSYIEIGFERCKKDIIREVVLGPKCRIDQFDLRILLLKCGYIDDLLSDDITIRQSMAPYI